MTVKLNLQSEIKLVVWMVAYNHEAYIEKAIESIMIQETDFKYQLLIGEDCSTDGTRLICQKLKAKYPGEIELYLHENNRGAHSNGVFLYDKCFQSNAKYVALCEGDDYWIDPLKLQKQVDFLEANPSYVLCYHDSMVVDSENKIIKHSKLENYQKKDFSRLELNTAAFVLTNTVCFRNVVNNFPENQPKGLNGDVILWSLLGDYGKGKYMDYIGPAAYRVHEGGIWSSLNDLAKTRNSLSTIDSLYEYYLKRGHSQATSILREKKNRLQYEYIAHRKNRPKVVITRLLKEKNLKSLMWYFMYLVSKTFFGFEYWTYRKFSNSLLLYYRLK